MSLINERGKSKFNAIVYRTDVGDLKHCAKQRVEMTNSNMAEIITGFHFDSGSSARIVDYGQTIAFTRPNGDRLSVAVVADCGQTQGQQSAQVAVNALITTLKQSPELSISDMLNGAVVAAHHAIHLDKSMRNKGDSNFKNDGCSLAVALIHNGEKLYIANVGNCGIYFVRDGKFSQLSLDHTFKNIAPILGKMDAETAESNPDADKLVRNLGSSDDVEIDVGFHIGQTSSVKAYALAQSRGKKGLPLQTGDAVLVCSDGLFRNHDMSAPALIHQDEIIQILSTQEGDRAARGLVSFALGRNAADNVSAAILQTPDPSRAINIVNQAKMIRQRTALLFGGLTALILLFYVTAIWLFRDRPDVDLAGQPIRIELADINDNTPTFNGDGSGTATAELGPDIRATQTVFAILAMTEDARPTETPTPTKTPRPTLQPGQIGVFWLRDQTEPTPVFEDQLLFASQIAEAQINHEGIDAEDASIYTQQASEIEFSQVDKKVEFRLFEESDIFIETGLYTAGAEIEVRADDGDVLFSVAERFEGTGACMGVEYSEKEEALLAYCYKGDCHYQIGRDEPIELQVGLSIAFETTDLSLDPIIRSIPQAVTTSYERLLANSPGGARDINACLGTYLPATPTPTATSTIFVPPATEESQEPTKHITSTPRSATNTPATKTPTAKSTLVPTKVPTSISTKTHTPVATASATVKPPTNTPLPSKTPASTKTAVPTKTLKPSPTSVVVPTKTATAPVPTQTPLPTKTALPTHTPIPTKTAVPTKTLIPTQTPWPTKTAVPTKPPIPTATPTKVIIATVLPPTNTPLPVKTSTPVIGATLVLPTQTPIVFPTISIPTPTKEPVIVPTLSVSTPLPTVMPTIENP